MSDERKERKKKKKQKVETGGMWENGTQIKREEIKDDDSGQSDDREWSEGGEVENQE